MSKSANDIFELVDDIKNIANNFVKSSFSNSKVPALPYTPFEVELSDGWAGKVISKSENKDTWFARAAPGTVLPIHHHSNQSEIVTVIHGSCIVSMGGEQQRLRAGDAILIPKGEHHSMESDAIEGCELIMVYQPPISTLTTTDLVRNGDH